MRFTARRDGAGDAPFLEPPFTDREEAESRARWETAKRRQAERTALGGTDLATLGVLAAALVGLGRAERGGWIAPGEEAPLPAPTWDQVATEVDDALTRLTLSWRPAAEEAWLAKEKDGTGAEVLGPYWSALGSGGAEGEDRPRPAPAEGLTIAAAPAPAEVPAPAGAPRAEATGATPPAVAPVSVAETAEAVPRSPDPVPIRLAEDASGRAPSTAPIPEAPSAPPSVARAEDGVGRPAAVAAATPDETPSARADAPRAEPPGLAATTPAAAPDGQGEAPGPSVAETKPGAEPAAEADGDTPPGLAVAAAPPDRADAPGQSGEVRDAPPGLAVAAAAQEKETGKPDETAPQGLEVAAAARAGGQGTIQVEPEAAIPLPAPRGDSGPAEQDAGWDIALALPPPDPAEQLPPGLVRLAAAGHDPGPPGHAAAPDLLALHSQGARADEIL